MTNNPKKYDDDDNPLLKVTAFLTRANKPEDKVKVVGYGTLEAAQPPTSTHPVIKFMPSPLGGALYTAAVDPGLTKEYAFFTSGRYVSFGDDLESAIDHLRQFPNQVMRVREVTSWTNFQ